MSPSAIVLPSNRPPHRFYLGGRRITDFRGDPPAGDHEPEDWIASTTHVFGQQGVGETTLPDGRRLADAIAADPVGWLGADHARRWGADPKLLVKLLDAGQRLPVHAHPDAAFAAAHLGAAHGKAEAWLILRPGTVHIGLRQDVTALQLRALVDEQDAEALLALLNPVDVARGDAVLVPAGQLHAIGEGVLLLEVQEPEDLSILLEWRDFDLDGTRDGHLGLGFDVALAAVETRALDDVGRLVRRARGPGRCLPEAADEWFRIDRLTGGDAVPDGFAVLVVDAGPVVLDGEPLPTGRTVVMPAAAPHRRLDGDGSVLVCRPPAC